MANILVIIPYKFYPATFGGALRCFHLLREYAKYHNVFLLTVQPLSDFSENVQPGFPKNISILSIHDERKIRTIFNLLPPRYANAINSRIIQKNLFKRGNQALLDSYLILKKLFLSEKIDYVIYENMQSFGGLNQFIKKVAPAVEHIYDAHNVDSELWKAQAALIGNPQLLQYGHSALLFERNLHNKFSLCFCCSEKDKEVFDKLNDNRANIVVIPNGVDTIEKSFDNNPEKFTIQNILFCGTLDYAPNKEGIRWFANDVFPLITKKHPALTLTIIGKMDSKKDNYNDLRERESIVFIGEVEDVRPYYYSSSISVVPLLNGSGTRLKILEAMSLGTPVVSTPIGAEGLDLSDGEDFLMANNAESFAAAVVQLLADPNLFNKIQLNSRLLAEHKYDWQIIGEKAISAISSLTN